jgi:hypothetical protein
MAAGAAISQENGRTRVDALLNAVAQHSPPMALAFVANGLLGANSCEQK